MSERTQTEEEYMEAARARDDRKSSTATRTLVIRSQTSIPSYAPRAAEPDAIASRFRPSNATTTKPATEVGDEEQLWRGA